MRKMFLAMVFLMALAGPLYAATKRLPVTFVLRDDYRGFKGPTLTTARHGQFEVCLGECHEGDPGFDGQQTGDPFFVGLTIYHLEPKRAGLPYTSTSVDVAKGKMNRSVAPVIRGTKRVRWKGVTFEVRIVKLSTAYGKGQSRVEVTAREQ